MQVAELMTWVETAEHALAQVREALSVEDPVDVAVAAIVADTSDHALAQVGGAVPEDSMALNPEPVLPQVAESHVIPDGEGEAVKSDVDAILNAAAVPHVTPEQIAELLRVAQSLGMTPEEFTAKTREFFGVESLEELPATGPKSAEVLLASMQKRVSYGA